MNRDGHNCFSGDWNRDYVFTVSKRKQPSTRDRRYICLLIALVTSICAVLVPFAPTSFDVKPLWPEHLYLGPAAKSISLFSLAGRLIKFKWPHQQHFQKHLLSWFTGLRSLNNQSFSFFLCWGSTNKSIHRSSYWHTKIKIWMPLLIRIIGRDSFFYHWTPSIRLSRRSLDIEFRVPIEERLSIQTKDDTALHQSQGEPPIPVK